jgi:hypothetical protein
MSGAAIKTLFVRGTWDELKFPEEWSFIVATISANTFMLSKTILL